MVRFERLFATKFKKGKIVTFKRLFATKSKNNIGHFGMLVRFLIVSVHI